LTKISNFYSVRRRNASIEYANFFAGARGRQQDDASEL